MIDDLNLFYLNMYTFFYVIKDKREFKLSEDKNLAESLGMNSGSTRTNAFINAFGRRNIQSKKEHLSYDPNANFSEKLKKTETNKKYEHNIDKKLFILRQLNKKDNENADENATLSCLYKIACKNHEEVYSKGINEINYAAILKYINELNDEVDKLKDMFYSLTSNAININIKVISKEYFHKVMKYGRFKSYNDSKKNFIEEIENRLSVNGEDKSMTLEDIVFNNKTSLNAVKSVSLLGRGGSGKTHQMLRLIDMIISSHEYANVMPFYLPLNIFNNMSDKSNDNNIIIARLAEEIGKKLNHQIDETLLNSILRCKHPYENNIYVLFLDGLNEVTNGTARDCIVRDICEIIEETEYSSVRVILSSRRDYSSLLDHHGKIGQFVKAEVNELKPEQINNYFSNIEKRKGKLLLRYENLSYETKKLLHSPQGLAMYTELMLDDSKQTFTSLADLIEKYINKIVYLPEDSEDFIFPHTYISYDMVLQGKFNVQKDKVKIILNTTSIENKNAFFSSSESIFSLSDATYEYTHQNFRDYFCALFLKNLIYIICDKDKNDNDELDDACRIIEEYFNKTSNAMDDEILILLSGLLNVEKVQQVFEIIIKAKRCDKYSVAINNLIRTVSLASEDKDISMLRFCGMDLRKVFLNGYKLYSNKKLCDFADADVCDETFLNPGLEGGSSVICQYSINDKIYVAAFSNTNILIYDVSKDEWQIIRNLKNGSWVNCCCVMSIDNEIRIILGCRTGEIVIFNPYKRKTVNVLVIQDGEEISSIVEWNNEYILFSTSKGKVYAFSAKELQGTINDKKIAIKSILLYDFNYVNDCKLSLSDKDIFVGCGNKIICCSIDDFIKSIDNRNFDEFTSFKCCQTYMPYEVIKDICYTDDLLYVNLHNSKSNETDEAIAYLSCLEFNNNGEKKKVYEPVTLSFKTDTENNVNAKKCFNGFTKLSVGRPGEVICGVNSINFQDLSNFYICSIRRGELSLLSLPGVQKLKTYLSVYYNPDSSDASARIATVSDDRSVQILAPYVEDFVPVVYNGSYYGVHYIEVVNEKEILTANYDGSVSDLIKDENGWQVSNVYPIHNDWVWKVKYFKSENAFISCSYDGTVKKTSLESRETETLITINDAEKRCIDFDIQFYDNNQQWKLFAITYSRVYSLFNEEIQKINLEEYDIRSVESLRNDNIMFALNNNEGHYIKQISDILDREYDENCIVAEKECGFIRSFKRYKLKNGATLLILVGNTIEYLSNEKGKTSEYFAFYIKDTFDNKWSLLGANFTPIDPTLDLSSAMLYEYSSNTGFYDRRSINDFSVDIASLSLDYNKLLNFNLYIANKNNKIGIWKVSIHLQAKKVDLKLMAEIDCDAQPMCINARNGRLLIGLLNGYIREIDISKLNELLPAMKQFIFDGRECFPKDFDRVVIDNIRIHSNLVSNINVNLRYAKFESENKKQQFKEIFKGYFSFER